MRSGAPRPRILWYPITRDMLFAMAFSKWRGDEGSPLMMSCFLWRKVYLRLLSEVRYIYNMKGEFGDPTITA